MGVGSSVPLKNELKQKTMRTSELIQRILSWMLKESNLLDYYALASPTECKKYVMFTAENLDSLFKDIQLQPVRDQKGKIYFRKITELVQMPEELERKRKENCYHIAYFFIRILQVFAALSLSVMDTEIPASFAVLESQAERKKNTRYMSPEEFKALPLFASKQQPQQQKRGFWGGAIAHTSRFYIRNKNYSILNRYLTTEGNGYFQLFDEGRATGLRISEDSLMNNRYVFIYKGTDSLGKKIELLAYLTMRYEEEGIQSKYYVKLDKFHLNSTPYPYVHDEVLFKGADTPEYNNQTLPRYIKNEFIRVVGKPLHSNASNVKTLKSAEDLPKDIDPKFQIREIWKVLGQKPPVKAYCVARALQLLSPESIYDSSLKQAARTSICDTKFPLQDTSSVPTPGKSVTSSASILSLNLLFFDVLENTIPSVRNKDEYKGFLNFLRNLWEENLDVVDKEILDIHKNIDGIRETMNPKLCAGKTGPLFTKDPQAAKELRSTAGELINRQIVHTANVLKVLEQLFVIREGQSLLLRQEIQEGGIEAVNNVAEVARKLLVSYYGDCEKLYRLGVVSAAERSAVFTPA
jgi:hypothetical protein